MTAKEEQSIDAIVKEARDKVAREFHEAEKARLEAYSRALIDRFEIDNFARTDRVSFDPVETFDYEGYRWIAFRIERTQYPEGDVGYRGEGFVHELTKAGKLSERTSRYWKVLDDTFAEILFESTFKPDDKTTLLDAQAVLTRLTDEADAEAPAGSTKSFEFRKAQEAVARAASWLFS